MTDLSLATAHPGPGLAALIGLHRPGASVGAGSVGLDHWRRLRAPRSLVESALISLRTLAPGHVHAATTVGAMAESGLDGPAGADDGPVGPHRGDAQVSLEDLIHGHSDAIYRVALSVTRDPMLAEDVSQDALIKAWTALPSFRGDAPLRNWVLRITHNTAISALRRRREEVRDPSELPERLSRISVEDEVEDRLAIDRFEAALSDLDSVSRSIVVLREVEGLTYGELCDVLDLPMPTIKTRLLRARRQLAQALEGWQP